MEGDGEVAGKEGALWTEGRIVIIYHVMGRHKGANLRMARVLDRLDCVSRINETLESGLVYDLCNVTKHRKMLSRCKTSEERKCGRGRASTDEIKGVRRVEIFETSTAIFRQFGGRILTSTNCIDPTSIAE